MASLIVIIGTINCQTGSGQPTMLKFAGKCLAKQSTTRRQVPCLSYISHIPHVIIMAVIHIQSRSHGVAVLR